MAMAVIFITPDPTAMMEDKEFSRFHLKFRIYQNLKLVHSVSGITINMYLIN